MRGAKVWSRKNEAKRRFLMYRVPRKVLFVGNRNQSINSHGINKARLCARCVHAWVFLRQTTKKKYLGTNM